MAIVELELGLHKREAGSYAIEFRFSSPKSEVEPRVTAKIPTDKFDIEGLEQKRFDIECYGTLLTESLFSDNEVKLAFAQARAIADAENAPLRFRLLIGQSVPELHKLYWESLRDPSNGSPLFTGERVLFSRYLASADWRSVQRRPKTELHALIAIANPTDVVSYQPSGRPLTALDVAAEMTRAKMGLEGIACVELASGGTATLDRIIAQLRDGCDVLYLVCHGALIDGEPWLWMEDESGKSQRVAASELIKRVRELRAPPALVVLASCQSAGAGNAGRTSDAGVMAALGPGLAEAGISAILAMQGDVTIATVAKFMPIFFRELQRDGQIDRAVAAARGAVRDRDDWFVPVLFMRLKGGCLWYAPGFDDEKLDNWAAIIEQIRSNEVTPILGPGITDMLLGSRREMARRWAETYQFPMEPNNRETLPQVAQFLAIKQRASNFPKLHLVSYLLHELQERYRDQLSNDVRQPKQGERPAQQLNRIISALGKQRRERDPNEPCRVLANCPIPLFITTVASDLISDALQEAGKKPRVDFCRWKDALINLPSIYDEDQEPKYRPSVEEPLVYHLFGRLQYPDSVVLMEDEYFEFLIGMTKNIALVPKAVRGALVNSGLILLGFPLDDWDFRVMFRAIMCQEGAVGRWGTHAHVAAQVDPEEGKILEPRGAHEYLRGYFNQASIGIFWGSAEDFTCELARQLQSRMA
jgi:hypothetical protein